MYSFNYPFVNERQCRTCIHSLEDVLYFLLQWPLYTKKTCITQYDWKISIIFTRMYTFREIITSKNETEIGNLFKFIIKSLRTKTSYTLNMYAPSCVDWTVFNARLMGFFLKRTLTMDQTWLSFFIRTRVQTTIPGMETHPISSSRRYTDD